jgi:fatty acid desaturase
MQRATPSERRASVYMVAETVLVFALLFGATVACWRSEIPFRWAVLAALVVMQGLWLDRMYIAAHEAIHKKLFPGRPALNDALGTLLLFPVAAPFTVYRKIHYFHHGHNRRDHHTANLDTFTSRAPLTPLRRGYYHAVWIFFVFFGGFFVHSLVSVLLFLLVPTARAERISPVFKHWSAPRRLRSWAELAGGVAFHAAVWAALGAGGWLVAIGLPLAVFAWVWSLLLYVYHYDTTVGPDVRHNVRSLPRQRFFSWLLLNFNEHATHHYDPTIPWHQLPERRHVLPDAFHENQKVTSIWQAIWQQRKGPQIEEIAEVGEFSIDLGIVKR